MHPRPRAILPGPARQDTIGDMCCAYVVRAVASIAAATVCASVLCAGFAFAAETDATGDSSSSDHWAFRPVRDPTPPSVDASRPDDTPIDRFVRARLAARGLDRSPPASRRVLIRRLVLDLTGLYPTPEEVEEFVNDPEPEAWEKLVDRLLASPRYGERWGRHWLDVARYADTKGYVFAEERRFPFSYTYRDWVIRSFAEDLPYDRFVVAQLAADRLDLVDDRAPLAAMGFLTLGRRFLNNRHDIIDDRIDVVTRGLLGFTVQCARCHDHPYDPIPLADYYSLYGVFASSQEPKEPPQIGPATNRDAQRAYENELAERSNAVAAFREKKANEVRDKLGREDLSIDAAVARFDRAAKNRLRELQKRVDQLRVTHDGAPAHAMVLVDVDRPADVRVFLRGKPGAPGDVAPRRFLTALSRGEPPRFRDGSGRLELARAIVDPVNPLTARVLVNRVWRHHFGAALVRTPSDFGTRADPPTHPDLLDWLATRFVEDDWSLKSLHRRILLSHTWRQSSAPRTDCSEADPANFLVWRMNPRRLEFEALRDALLAAAGRLDTRFGGRPVDLFKRPFTTRRTVYGFIDRQNLPGLLRAFDFASPDATSSGRHTTTVPQQALWLMNGPFLGEQAERLLARPDVAELDDPPARIERLYRILFGRSPADAEIDAARRFLRGAGGAMDGTRWTSYAQALLVTNEFTFVD